MSYKARWIYSDSCTQKGKTKVFCEDKTIKEFAEKMISSYAFALGDGFSAHEFLNNDQLHEAEIIPKSVLLLHNSKDRALVLTSRGFHSILINPGPMDIVKHLARNEDYGDYVLKITGVKGI